MVVTLWLLSLLITTLITASECVYASPPLVNYRRSDYAPFGIQDDFMPAKRSKPSLSIVNPLDVLRQRLMLEIARRQMRENSKQVEINRAILKNVGKRSGEDVGGGNQKLQRERFEESLLLQQPNLNAGLEAWAEAASSDERQLYAQLPDYFDENNAVEYQIPRQSNYLSQSHLASSTDAASSRSSNNGIQRDDRSIDVEPQHPTQLHLQRPAQNVAQSKQQQKLQWNLKSHQKQRATYQQHQLLDDNDDFLTQSYDWNNSN